MAAATKTAPDARNKNRRVKTTGQNNTPVPAASHELERNPGFDLDMGWLNEVRVNTQAVQRDALDIVGRRSIKKLHQVAWYLKAITMIDLTDLNGDSTDEAIRKLCAKALQPLHANTLRQLASAGLNIQTGAVCLYDQHLPAAVAALEGTDMPTAAVSTGFPHAQNSFEERVAEIKRSVAKGAKEIDVVITREHVLKGDWQKLYEEIKAFREACGDAHMKTIFETGELGSMDNVAKASRVAMMAGSDFIKTSTGKATINANLAVSLVMMREIRNFHKRNGVKVGFKPAGGIATASDALKYLTLVKEVLGNEWLTPKLFRFGASSLLGDLARQIYHQITGNYADTDYMDQREIKFKDAQLQEIAKNFNSMDYGTAPEADNEAKAWLDAHGRKFGHYINNEFVEGAGEVSFDSVNPADGKTVLATLKHATQAEVNKAVEVAADAQDQWAATSGFDRSRFLYALARGVQKHAKLFAVLESMDNGKPFRETFKVDVPLVARHLRYHAGMAHIADQKFPGFEPHGVVGQIIPWNFPLLMLAWKVAPAIAAGNAVVLKPAEQTPLTAMLFAELCKEAAEETGAPAGLVNIVNGDGRVGEMLVKHPDIKKLAFTGSTEVGRKIREASAGTGKALTLELGGKSPFIVFEDADLDAAVEGVINAIFFNQGQVCCGGSRLFLQESIKDVFLEKLKARMANLRVGNPLDKSVDMGAVIDPTQKARIASFVEEAKQGGAEVYQAPQGCPDNGCFYPPTLVTNVDPSDRIMQEEVFGPVLCATTFRTHEEVVKLANQTPYGLAASIWGENMGEINQVAAKLKCGDIWINRTNQFDASAGFGGYKESGFGREGGDEGMMAYLKPSGVDIRGDADVDPPVTAYKSVEKKLINETPKLYIGKKQTRSDGGYTQPVVSHDGIKIGEVGIGNRKDIRDAVSAAEKAASWANVTPDTKSQILHFMAENLSKRREEFAARLQSLTGDTIEAALGEVEMSLEALFNAAAWSDKYEGPTHRPPSNAIIPTLNEPVGIIGISCPNEYPLLSMVSMIGAAIAMGNRVVVTPSEKYSLLATDFYQVLDTSDVPEGVVNIVTGKRDELADTLSRHEAVNAVWYHGSQEGSAMIERNAANSNLKQTWTNAGKIVLWDQMMGFGMQDLLHRATQVKNIWVPFGEGTGPG